MTKYKPCCGRRCPLGNCETREEGGCYCLCRLKDAESSYLSLLAGSSYRYSGAQIYVSGKTFPLSDDEKKEYHSGLEQIREKIKDYEIGE
jgi:hypothetical protein